MKRIQNRNWASRIFQFFKNYKGSRVPLFFLNKEQIGDAGINLGNLGDTTNRMFNRNEGPLPLNCPRRFDDTEGLKCNMIEINSVIKYGSKSKHNLTITTGIAQQMLSLNSDN